MEINEMEISKSEDTKRIPALTWVQWRCHDIAKDHGFWDDAPRDKHDPIWMLSRLMLMVTELAEAAEDVRHDNWEHLGEELADTCIRIFDTAEYLGIDLGAEIMRKMKVNMARPHKHGKNS